MTKPNTDIILKLKWKEFLADVDNLANEIYEKYISRMDQSHGGSSTPEVVSAYGIPKNGTIVAALMAKRHRYIEFTADALAADIWIDDVYETGETYNKYLNLTSHPRSRFFPLFVLYDKSPETRLYCARNMRFYDPMPWIVMPWERDKND